jgi:sigma-54 specific flagellar transcriptional regulator A
MAGHLALPTIRLHKRYPRSPRSPRYPRYPRSAAGPLPSPLDDQTFPPGGLNLKEHLSRVEVTLIREALLESDGGVAGAARLLRMRRTTLVEKMRKYRLSG